MSAIVACRTEALGGHMEACDNCGMTRIAYNSCGNRHCPKCQGRARVAWLAAREADLLPVPYFHVVFTLPAPIAAIAFQNKAAAEAMTTLAANTTTEGLPLLLDAAGRCPPEDVGGAPGYAEYLDAISDPTHPEHEQMRRWGPKQFDPNVVDRKALDAAVNALSDTWKPRPRAIRTK